MSSYSMAPPGDAVLKHRNATLGRVERFISNDAYSCLNLRPSRFHGSGKERDVTPEFYNDVNIRSRLYRQRAPMTSICHFAATGRIPYEQAKSATYEPVSVPYTFGPTWSTHWFRLEVALQSEWRGQEVRLLWDADCEGLVWKDGKPLQGVNGFPQNMIRRDIFISKELQEDERNQVFYIEMACNGMLGEGEWDAIMPPDLNRKFTLSNAELVVIDHDVLDLLLDMDALLGIAKHLPTDSHRGNEALLVANDMLNVLDLSDKTTYKKAGQMAQEFLSQKNGQGQLILHAMGHCHIDCAWLWPYAETIRKCARSWASTIQLLSKYPDMTFTCSQAQQFSWVKDHYPALYEDIKHYVKEGRFIPVGGSWVEMDGNLPSGESFVRQMLYGQQFFRKEFGITCAEFWLPDTFGYSAQLPQIMTGAGMRRFLTQKISWCVNKFPHHTFLWEGLDGSQVLTHFPPGDSYHMAVTVDEVMRTVDNCQDKGRVRNFGFLYGYGDGGGGPTELMLERLKRLQDVHPLPRVVHSNPDVLFSAMEKTELPRLCRWVGELYLEFHQGTYTSQSETKRMNRKCEVLLHDVEFLSSAAMMTSQMKYPRGEIERIWKLLLLNQFHDVLPGSSINEVYKDAMEYFEDIQKSGNTLLTNATKAIFSSPKSDGGSNVVAVNTIGWPRSEVVELPSGSQSQAGIKQTSRDGKALDIVNVPSCGYSYQLSANKENPEPVSISTMSDGNICLQNQHLTAKIDGCGRVVSLVLRACARETVTSPANQLVLFEDIPVYWDAWDVNHYHLETRKPVQKVLETAKVVESGPLRVAVQVTLAVGDRSKVTQVISLDALSPYLKVECEVSWWESHQMLKVEFPLDVRASAATYEMQFGHTERPTHFNTEWDWMKFEVPGHKWMDLSEHDFGVAILNDCKYGHSAHDNIVRLSLLRSPKSPDETADMGTHHVTYAIYPHQGTLHSAEVVRHAHALNYPIHLHVSDDVITPERRTFFEVDHPGVVLDTVKQAENVEGALVLRLFESLGGKSTAHLKAWRSLGGAKKCNLLEEPLENNDITLSEDMITLVLKPFEIVTLLVSFL